MARHLLKSDLTKSHLQLQIGAAKSIDTWYDGFMKKSWLFLWIVIVGCQQSAVDSSLQQLKGSFVTVSIRKDIQGATEVTPALGSIQSSDRVRSVYGKLIDINEKFVVVEVQAQENLQAHTTVVPWNSIVAVDSIDLPSKK